MKLASTEIAEFYREVKRVRGKHNPISETFTVPGTTEIVENMIGVPVKLLNRLLKEKHK